MASKNVLSHNKFDGTKTNPKILFCGYCKSGTTIITKTFAHCMDTPWKNEIKRLWGIGKLIDRGKSLNQFQNWFSKEQEWLNAQHEIGSFPILKFPEGILIIDLFPPNTSIVCIVRHPLDTICAYLERQHEFKTLSFSQNEILKIAEDWNYHYLATKKTKRPIIFVRLESFITQPQIVISDISYAIHLPIKKSLPEWINKQVTPYFRYVPTGHKIRGIGRYKLSIKSQKVVKSILSVCDPALSHLRINGINFDDIADYRPKNHLNVL